MKDWQRSPEPMGLMGAPDTAYSHLQGNWGQPEELFNVRLDPPAGTGDDFDPAAPLPGRQPLQSTVQQRSSLSLYTMCQRVILRNLVSVQDLGDMPYRNAKPILEACRIDQLIMLEEASPHLLENSEEIWRRNCLQDFIELRKKYGEDQHRKPPKSWRALYIKTRGRMERSKVEAAQRIKDKYAQHKAEKMSKRLVVSDKPLMKVKAQPSGIRSYGSASKGQSLLNKARSGSAAHAQLITPRPSARPPKGRTQAAAAEIVPAYDRTIRPMVAPKTIKPVLNEGLVIMRNFSKPVEEDIPSAASTRSKRTSSADTQPLHTGLCQSPTKMIDFFGRASSNSSNRGTKRAHDTSAISPARKNMVITRTHPRASIRNIPSSTSGERDRTQDGTQSNGHEVASSSPANRQMQPARIDSHIPSGVKLRPASEINNSQASAASLSSIFAPLSSRGKGGRPSSPSISISSLRSHGAQISR